MVSPLIPGQMADYCAGRRAGVPLRCEDYESAAQPAACRDAYADVVWWSAAFAFANAVATFLLVRRPGGFPRLCCCSFTRPSRTSRCAHG